MKSKAIVKICVCGVIALVLIAALVGLIFFGGNWGWPFNLPFANVYADEEAYHIGNVTTTGEVSRVELYWSSGEIRVSTHEGDEISIHETGEKGEDSRLRWRLENGVLTIRFAKSGFSFQHPDKTLELELPAATVQQMKIEVASAATMLNGMELDSLIYDTASGDLRASDCSFDRVEVDGASASCTMERCTVGSFDMDAASGTAKLNGSVRSISFEAASGNLKVVTDVAPRSIEVDTASGDADITLPKDAGFRAEHDAASGDFNVEGFMGNYSGDTFRCGDGSGDYEFDSASGDVILRAAD